MQKLACENFSSKEKAEQNSRIKRLRRLSWLLDNSIRIPWIGYRIGLDAVMGIVPGVGDTVGAALSGYIIYEASRLGIPKRVQARMAYNVAVEYLVGLIPVLGDVFDAAWKANAKNVDLLEKHLGRLEDSDVLSQ